MNELARKNILVVDDDYAILQMFCTALSVKGYHVTGASNGIDGLKQLKDKEIDMVITDWKMPIMNGISMLQKIRSNNSLKHIPVLMVSATEMSSVRQKANDLGACTWLKKPFKFKQLLSVVNEVLA